MSEREQKIQKLARTIVAFEAMSCHWECFWCHAAIENEGVPSMEDFDHSENCPYRLAVDILETKE